MNHIHHFQYIGEAEEETLRDDDDYECECGANSRDYFTTLENEPEPIEINME